jgi:hypothetical protein
VLLIQFIPRKKQKQKELEKALWIGDTLFLLLLCIILFHCGMVGRERERVENEMKDDGTQLVSHRGTLMDPEISSFTAF